MNDTKQKRRGPARLAGVAALTVLGSVTLAAGSAEASVWRCDGVWCTTAANNAPVYSYIDGPYLYTIPRGAVVGIVCYFGDPAHGVWYAGGQDGHANGVINGKNLATGHDPNPNIPYCS